MVSTPIIQTETPTITPYLPSSTPQDRWSRDKHIELVNIVDFLFEEEPKKVSEALMHSGWVDVMQEELNQFAGNKVWTLLPPPYGKSIIGSKFTSTKLCKQFAKLMTHKYEMSMMGVLTYFLGFQIKHYEKGISINQENYVKDLLKKYDINSSSVKAPMVPERKSTSAEAKYVVVAGCCANILWMKSQLSDYDILYEKMLIFCDNT
ncbi:retrovirus-related pol polyprotein from transposon TNT 1-94, partial [Tanacetum coccineum]